MSRQREVWGLWYAVDVKRAPSALCSIGRWRFQEDQGIGAVLPMRGPTTTVMCSRIAWPLSLCVPEAADIDVIFMGSRA